MNNIEAALPVVQRMHLLLACQGLLSIAVGFSFFRIFPFTGSILVAWVLLGMIAVRRMRSCGLKAYGFLSMVALGAALGAFFGFRHVVFRSQPSFLLIVLGSFAWFVQLSIGFCAIRLAKILSEMPQSTEDSFELHDLEAQEAETAQASEYPGYAPVPQSDAASPAPAPAASPAPIYIAAPAYYPQLNENPPAYIYGQHQVPQFVPVFIDASGKPLAPIHTQ